MSFTDDYLKRLKEEIEISKGFNLETHMEVSCYRLNDLLARLEAGERALKWSLYQCDKSNPHLEAWRKAAGKGGPKS